MDVDKLLNIKITNAIHQNLLHKQKKLMEYMKKMA